MPLKKLTYRPDIDGLRALAVLSVILFHINPQYMPSGFLGVDIFFVISGFLITSIIYKEMAEGTFTFANFYNRRIKRILPVFFVVLAFVLFISYTLYSELDYWRIQKSTITSVFFISNLYFARGAGYFDTSMEQNPLGHIWSLSVEEQFYFIFPIVLLLLLKFNFFRKYLLSTLSIVGIALLSLSFVNLNKIGLKLDVYYLPHLRMAELLVGSILSIYILEKGNHLSEKRSNILGIVSLLVLFLCLLMRNFFVSPYFPGFLALLPCIAVATLILANEKGKYTKKIFSLKPIVWIGKISYSLYLWHWVILAFFRYFFETSKLSYLHLFIATPLIFVLSVITYYAVEQPFRKVKLSFTKSFLFFYFIPTVLSIAFLYLLESKVTWKQYLPIKCNECKTSEKLTEIGDLNSVQDKKILLVGDSHCVHIVPFVDVVAKKEGWKASVLSKGGCSSVLKNKKYDDTKLRDYYECHYLRDYFQNNYKNFDIFLLANFYMWEENEDPYNLERFELTLQQLLNENKKVYLIKSSVPFDADLERIESLKKIGVKREFVLNGTDYKKHLERWKFIKNYFSTKYPTVEIIDLLPYIPKDGYIEEKNIMFDKDHIKSYGAKKIAEKFIQDGKIMIK